MSFDGRIFLLFAVTCYYASLVNSQLPVGPTDECNASSDSMDSSCGKKQKCVKHLHDTLSCRYDELLASIALLRQDTYTDFNITNPKVDTLQSQMVEEQQLSSQLQNDVSSLNVEVDELQIQTAATETSFITINRTVSDIQTTTTELTSSVAAEEASTVAMTTQINEMDANLNETSTNLASTMTVQEGLSAQIEEVCVQTGRLEQTVYNESCKIEETIARIDCVETTINETTSEIQTIVKSQENLTCAVEELSNQTCTLEAVLEEEKCEVEEMKALVEEQNCTITQLVCDAAIANETQTSLKASQEELCSEVVGVKTLIEEQSCTVTELLSSVDNITCLLAENPIINGSVDINQIMCVVDNVTCAMEELKATVQNETCVLTEQVQQLKDENCNLTEKVETLDSRMCEMEAMLAATVATIMATTSLVEERDCPEGYTTVYKDDGHVEAPLCIKFHTVEHDFNAHVKMCEHEGLKMVEPMTEYVMNEIKCIINEMPVLQNCSYYIGATDCEVEGTWNWLCGSPMTLEWGPNEPCSGTDKNCASLCTKNCELESVCCDDKMYAICQI